MLIELKAHLPFCLKHTLIYILYSNRIDSIKSVKQSSHYSLLLLFLLLPLEFSSILRLIGITVHKGCLEGLNKPLFFLDCSCLYMSIDRLLPYHVRNEVITKSQFSLTLTMWIVLQSSFRKWTIYSVDTIDLVFFFFFSFIHDGWTLLGRPCTMPWLHNLTGNKGETSQFKRVCCRLPKQYIPTTCCWRTLVSSY